MDGLKQKKGEGGYGEWSSREGNLDAYDTYVRVERKGMEWILGVYSWDSVVRERGFSQIKCFGFFFMRKGDESHVSQLGVEKWWFLFF